MMDLRKILCPVDFSQFSAAANEYASLLAQLFGAELIYLQVSLPDVTLNSYAYVDLPSLEKELRAELEKVVPTVTGVNAKYEIAFGSPAAKIVEFTKDQGVELIVMGTHGRTGWRRIAMGSVAEEVIRLASCPVLAIKGSVDEAKAGDLKSAAPSVQNPDAESISPPESIAARNGEPGVVCAIDANDYDQSVVDLAASFAKLIGVDLDLTHVTLFPDPSNAAWPAYLGSPDALIEDHRLFRKITTNVADVPLHYHHLSGTPSRKILEYLDRNQPKLLVMGTHGHRGLARLLGSTASHVLRHASCPVMVFRHGATCSPGPTTDADTVQPTPPDA